MSEITDNHSSIIVNNTQKENKNKENEQTENSSTSNIEIQESIIVSEVIEKREKYSKHFKLESGSYMAVSYTEPVNYLKDGKWEEIDNTLIAGTDGDLEEVYQNKSNSYNVTFAKSSSSGQLVTMQKDRYTIAWFPDTKKNYGLLDTEAEVINSNIEEKNLTNNDKMMDASKTRSTIIYKSVLPDIDLKYTVTPEKIKEDIIINNTSSISSFTFDLSAPELKARLNEDNSITFFDPEKPEVDIFSMPAPYMIDSSEEQSFSDKVDLLLTETEEGYELEIIPDAKWISAPERVFPIFIDPTLYSSQVRQDIIDTYVHIGDVAGEHMNADKLVVGNKTSTNEIRCRSLIQTQMPNLPWGSVVTDARLNLSITSGSSTFQNLNVYKINSEWSSSTMTWNLAEGISKTLVQTGLPATSYSNSPSAYRYSCNVTSAVQSIYEETATNYGFLVRYTNDTYADYNRFYSSDYTTSTVRPQLTVTYFEYDETTLTRANPVNRFLEQGGIQWYLFTPSESTNFTFFTSGSTDTYGELYQGSTLLQYDNDGGGDHNFSITRSLVAGTQYKLKVRGFNTSVSGFYTITVNYPARSATVNNYYDQGYVTRDADTPVQHISYYLNCSKTAFLQVFNLGISNNTPQSISSIADVCPNDGDNITYHCYCLGPYQVCDDNTSCHHCKNGWAIGEEIVNIIGSIPEKTFPVTWTGHVACGGGCIGNDLPTAYGAACSGKKYIALSIIHPTQDLRDIHSKMGLMHELAHCFGADDNGVGEECDDKDHCLISYEHDVEDMEYNHPNYSDWFCTKHKNQIFDYLANHGF